MRYFTGALLAVMVTVLVAPLLMSIAGDEKSQDAKLEIEKLTLFKNGLGFVTSGVELPRDAQDVRFGQLPVPTFGTFWVSYPGDLKVQSLVTSMEEVEREEPAQSVGHLVQMNTGRKVVVYTSDAHIEGTVLPTPTLKESPGTPSPYVMSPRVYRDPYSPYVPPAPSPANVLMIKTDKGVVALSPGLIIRAEFADGEPLARALRKQKTPCIHLKLDKAAGGTRVTVSYLAHGVSWMPGYLIDLSDPKTAKFSAHAVVVNEMTDLKDVKVQLVTGFPNIKFSEVLSPVAKSQTLAEFLNALSGAARGQRTVGSMLAQQAMVTNAIDASTVGGSALLPEYSTAAEGAVAEDLYFYPVKSLTLMKDETVWLPLFTAEMPYKHVYTWNIKDFVDAEDHYRTNPESQERKPAGEVWHSCQLVSTLNMPLTTAAAEFVTNGEFTGQDVCYYTPPKGETTIRINKALNILAEQGEIEVERKRAAYELHGYRYDLVKVKGELKVRNRLDKHANMEITKELSGEVLESIPKAKDVKTAKGLKQVNPKHMLTWAIELKAGEEQNISYQYQVYIRD